jgi:hypothetical protein
VLRKNFLCNTQSGEIASAVIFNIIEMAKENGLKPFEYLKYLFETMPNIDTKSLEETGYFSGRSICQKDVNLIKNSVIPVQ